MRSSGGAAALLAWLSCFVPALAAQESGDCASKPYDCAVVQVQRQEFERAIRTLEQLALQSPNDLRTLNLLGIALTGAGKTEEANRRFRQALALDPRFAPALRNLAVNEFTLGRLAESQRHFQEVLAQASDDEIAHIYLGEIQFDNQQFAEALAHYEKGGARVMQNPRWRLHLAASLFDGQRHTDAVALLEHMPGNDAPSWFDAGVLLGRHGAQAQAARAFAAAREHGYKDAYAAGFNQTLMLIEAGQNDAAIRVAQELFAQGGSSRAELHSLVSRAYARANRIKDAYDALREAIRLEPTIAEHYIDLTMLCLEHENYDLGLEIVDVGLKHRPDSSVLFLQRGVVLAMKGDVERADREFSRAMEAAPNDPAPYVARAMIWMQRGQTPKAVDFLRARMRVVTRAGTPQAVIAYALGIALLRSGAAPDDADGTEALEAFRTAVRLQPSFVQAQAELGKLLLKRGDVSGAVTHLERAIALEPDNAAPMYVLAQAYRRHGQQDRARELLARVSRLNAQERGDDPDTELRRMMFRIVRDGTGGLSSAPSSKPSDALAAKAAVAAAVACGAAGDLDGAILRLRESLERAPAAADTRYQLAIMLWNRYQRAGGRRQKSDLDEAIATLARTLEQERDRPQYLLVLGQMLAERQEIGPAIQHIQRAMALAPGDPEYAFNLGLALRLHGDLDAAEAQLRAALTVKPDHALARRALGLVLRQKGDVQGAVDELRRATGELPNDAQGHHLLGSVLLKQGKASDATSELQEALRLDPSLTEARVMLAQALAKQGHQDEAMRQQAEVQRLNAEKADFGRTLVLLDASAALRAKSDYAGAAARAREAIALSATSADAHYELGAALREMTGGRAEAEAAFRKAIALDPGHARAYLGLARVLEAGGDVQQARAAHARAAALAPCSVAQP